jgi:hypothetical protein
LQHQFGVAWPESFMKALDALSLLSLDFGVFAGIFCLVQMDFYDGLLSLTFSLCMTVTAVFVVHKHIIARGADAREREEIMQTARFYAGYILLFAFPVVSVDLVEAFACHEVEGVYYLRADYTVKCYTNRFYIMACYALTWIILYVVVFPILLVRKLFAYHRKIKIDKRNPETFKYNFLIVDYKESFPCILWEVRNNTDSRQYSTLLSL